MQTDDQVVGAELEKVVSKLETLYDIDDEFYSSIEKAPVEVKSNRDMRIPLKLRPGGYFGYFDPANGDLGTGDSTQYEKGVISTSHMKIAIQWDLKSQWGTDDKRKSLIQNVKENLADGMSEFRRQSDAQCMTAGTGVLATITSTATSGGNDTYTCTSDGYRVKLLRPGQRISVYDTTRATNRTAGGPVKISAVNLSANTFTIVGTVAGATGTDVILPEGLTGATPVGLFGIPYHQSDSTSGSWLGLTRLTTPEVVASSVDANSAALALPYARLAINKIADRIGINNKFKPVAWMHLAQVQSYEELGQLVSIIQKQAKDDNLNLYFGGNMQIAGCAIKTSMLWDKKRIDFLIPELWGRAELSPVAFHQLNGQKIWEMRGPSGGVATSFVSYILASWNLFTRNPAAGSYIKNLAIPSGY